jgi:hypothetical protein
MMNMLYSGAQNGVVRTAFMLLVALQRGYAAYVLALFDVTRCSCNEGDPLYAAVGRTVVFIIVWRG